MRIVVSGTHASGKSTLISDFALRHPAVTVLPDPFELIDESSDRPGAAMFAWQLRLAADRLAHPDLPANVIAERGPLDLLAYLLALDATGVEVSRDVLAHGAELTAASLRHVDVVVVLPLTASAPIRVEDDEDDELRDAMNDILLDLLADPDLIGPRTAVVEIVGSPTDRLAALESFLAG